MGPGHHVPDTERTPAERKAATEKAGDHAPPTDAATPRHHVEYWAMRVLACIVRLMPIDLASVVFGRIWALLAPMTRRQQRADRHLALAMPELSANERARIIHQMWMNYGRVMAETFHLDHLSEDVTRVQVEPVTADTFIRVEKQAVFVSLHMANWEVAIVAGRNYGVRPTSVYQAIQNPLIDAWLWRMRRPLYGALLAKSPHIARSLLAGIKRGGTIAVLGDLREAAGVEVPFFGMPALANSFPAVLARSSGAPLVAVRVRRLEGGARFLIDSAPIEVPETADRQADIVAATAALHQQFETWIRENPEQWMWTHRKWAIKHPKRGVQRRAAAQS